MQNEALSFRQRPILEDCFPSSSKEYREIQHGEDTLKVMQDSQELFYKIPACKPKPSACAFALATINLFAIEP